MHYSSQAHSMNAKHIEVSGLKLVQHQVLHGICSKSRQEG